MLASIVPGPSFRPSLVPISVSVVLYGALGPITAEDLCLFRFLVSWQKVVCPFFLYL